MDRNIEVGWSFCIVTAPNNHNILKNSIESILKEFKNIGNFEIIVVGKTQLINEVNNDFIRFFEINEDFFNIDLSLTNIKRAIKEASFKRLFYKYGPISYKKNFAAKKARYNKICMMHDYVSIEQGWLDGYNRFGFHWDLCMNIVLNKNNTRYRDWCGLDYKDIGAGHLPYDVTIKEMYISGTYFCVKTKFMIDNPFDESLYWGESEDIEWSKRIREKIIFKINTNSIVKFLKLKRLDQSPYCNEWIKNSISYQKLISSNSGKNGVL